MKIRLDRSFGWAAVIFLLTAIPLPAQSLGTLHDFAAGSGAFPDVFNSDGANPMAGLVFSGGALYGTTYDGGSNGGGSVFAVSTDGSGFAALHTFSTTGVNGFNMDGSGPRAGLVVSGGILYGTAVSGGSSGCGTVFSVKTDGTGFTVLHYFSATNSAGVNGEGANPVAALVLSGSTLYGVALNGGANGNGSLFSVRADGTGFSVLHAFSSTDAAGLNADGANPAGTLVLADGKLYGTAGKGGGTGNGTVFSINTNGGAFSTLYSFSGSGFTGLNTDGAHPAGGLAVSGGTLYGTTLRGGPAGKGAVFSLAANGSGFAVLHAFSTTGSDGVNNDGANPVGSLVLTGTTLYGTALDGGINGNGSVFSVNTAGGEFASLYNFSATGSDNVNDDGAGPSGGLVLSGNALYGTTITGGTNGTGAAFSLALAAIGVSPELAVVRSGSGVIASWPLSSTGWTLQTNRSLSGGSWGDYAGEVISNSVTTAAPGGNLFFRLRQ